MVACFGFGGGARAGHRRGPRRWAAACVAASLTIALSWFRASANETDQFLLPTDKPFADLGRLMSVTHYGVLATVTKDLNEQIRRAQDISDPSRRRARLEALHRPRRLADMIREEFGPGFFETLGVESSLRSESARTAFPGNNYLEFQRSDWVYSFAHLVIDPRNIPLLVPSSTIKVYGHYFGTDKLGHFHDLGHYYFCDYTAKRHAGKSEELALREVVATYSRGFISETAAIGFMSTGVCSNADLVSNYMGLKFYRNLTEPVMLEGRESPPMLILVGEYWQLNAHVRPDSDFLAPFFSDHWNEALNPCVYESGLRSAIEGKLHRRAGEVLAFYCGTDERPRRAGYFADLAVELSTYFGEDYGYYGNPAVVMSIATTCFGLQAPDAPAPRTPPPGPPQPLPPVPDPSPGPRLTTASAPGSSPARTSAPRARSSRASDPRPARRSPRPGSSADTRR